jgi:cytochrome c oxidase subunit 1
MLLTNTLDADPESLEIQPGPSIWPFLAALAVSGLFVGSIFTQWAVVYGAPPVIVTLIGWIWPKRGEVERRRQEERWSQ